MAVGVIPESPGRMIRRDIVFVGESRLRVDRQQDVIAVAGWAYPQPMGMEIGAVEAVRDIRHLRTRHAAGITGLRPCRQLVVEGDAHRAAGNRLDRRRNIRRIGVDALAGVAAQMDLVVSARGRIVDPVVDIFDLEIELAVAARRLGIAGQWRGGCLLLGSRLVEGRLGNRRPLVLQHRGIDDLGGCGTCRDDP